MRWWITEQILKFSIHAHLYANIHEAANENWAEKTREICRIDICFQRRMAIDSMAIQS